MNKFQSFMAKHKRKVIQLYAALLYNANIKGYITGEIYTGNTKGVCVPGLNCYSCPGAVGACPLGSLQNALSNANKSTLFYIVGILMLFGVSLGRWICGWICPVGLSQELLYKIPSPKIRKSKITHLLTFVKYIILFAMVIGIPTIYGLTSSYTVPAFCKYICPEGTFAGAIALLSHPNNSGLFPALGPLFTWKFIFLCIFLILSIFIFRWFCRFICPLGALYSLFNQFSIVGVKINYDKCNSCGKCIKECKMDIHKVGGVECIQCGKCISMCSANAISWKWQKDKKLLDTTQMININSVSSTLETTPIIEETPSKKPVEKKKIITTSIVAGVMVSVLIGALVYCNTRPNENNFTYNIGDKVSNFTLNLLNKEEGAKFELDNYGGKVVVINYWQTTCSSCVKEMHYFEEVYQEYKQDIEVIAVHGPYDGKDAKTFISGFYTNVDGVDKYWKDFDMMFALDNYKDNGQTSITYKSFGGKQTFPLTVILDQEGILRYRTEASIAKSTLENEVAKLVNK